MMKKINAKERETERERERFEIILDLSEENRFTLYIKLVVIKFVMIQSKFLLNIKNMS